MKPTITFNGKPIDNSDPSTDCRVPNGMPVECEFDAMDDNGVAYKWVDGELVSMSTKEQNEELWGDANYGIVQHVLKGTPIPLPEPPPTFEQVTNALRRKRVRHDELLVNYMEARLDKLNIN